MKNRELQKLLSRRQFDVTKLADQIFSNRAHVTLVLLGKRSGLNTWSKLKRVLTPQEYEAAKSFADDQAKKSGGVATGFPHAALRA